MENKEDDIFSYVEKLQKLQTDNRYTALENVRQDIGVLKEWADDVEPKLKYVGALIDTKTFLQVASIHILLISRLEYTFRALGKLARQWELPKLIRESNVLSENEKASLIHLFVRRHPVIHNSDHPDEEFHKALDRHELGYMKEQFPLGTSLLTTMNVRYTHFYADLIEKILDEEFERVFGFRRLRMPFTPETFTKHS